jgi:hypothetical protein
VRVSFETALMQWQDGLRRLDEAPPEERRMLERVSQAIEAELRRRLGGAFTTEELAGLYDQGTDWCLEIAFEAAPDNPRAWESQTVADAAFARYVREAKDFAGGRPRETHEKPE